MVTTLPFSKAHNNPITNPDEYRSVDGALQYATLTSPDIAFHVNKKYQFMHDPLHTH